jgi:porphobilinogen synthase
MSASFPTLRMRRLRHHPGVRRLVSETQLSPSDLILPMFVRPGRGERRPVESMPGVDQVSPDVLAEDVALARELGLGGVILFGIPASKDGKGSDAPERSGDLG